MSAPRNRRDCTNTHPQTSSPWRKRPGSGSPSWPPPPDPHASAFESPDPPALSPWRHLPARRFTTSTGSAPLCLTKPPWPRSFLPPVLSSPTALATHPRAPPSSCSRTGSLPPTDALFPSHTWSLVASSPALRCYLPGRRRWIRTPLLRVAGSAQPSLHGGPFLAGPRHRRPGCRPLSPPHSLLRHSRCHEPE